MTAVVLLVGVAGPVGVAGCSGAVTVASTRSAAPASSSAAVGVTPSTAPATLAGGGGTATQPPITGSAVPGSEIAKAVRDAVGSQSSVRMSMKTAAGTADATVDLARKAVRLDTGAEANPVSLVHANGSTWVKGAGTVSATSTAGVTERPWLLLRPDGTDVLSRKLGPAVNVEDSLRPAAFVDLFEGLTGDRSAGADGGSRVSFWVPADTYVRVVRGDSALSAAITAPVVVEVDLDSANRPTHLVATMSVKGARVVDDTTYSDWGAPVTVQTPAPDVVGVAPQPAVGTEAPDAGAPSGSTGSTDSTGGQGTSDAQAPQATSATTAG